MPSMIVCEVTPFLALVKSGAWDGRRLARRAVDIPVINLTTLRRKIKSH